MYVSMQPVCTLLASPWSLASPTPPLSYSVFQFHYCLEKVVPFGKVRLLCKPEQIYLQGSYMILNEGVIRETGTIWLKRIQWREDEIEFSELVQSRRFWLNHCGRGRFRVWDLGGRSHHFGEGRLEQRSFCRKWIWFMAMLAFYVTIELGCRLETSWFRDNRKRDRVRNWRRLLPSVWQCWGVTISSTI